MQGLCRNGNDLYAVGREASARGVWKINLTTSAITQIVTAAQLVTPNSVILEPGTGNLLVSDNNSSNGADSVVRKFSPSGTLIGDIATGLTFSDGLLYRPGGNLLIGTQTAVVELGVGNYGTMTASVAHNDMTFDQEGRLLVVNGGTNLYRIPAGGGAAVILHSGFGYASSVKTDAQGRIYVADFSASKIYRLDI